MVEEKKPSKKKKNIKEPTGVSKKDMKLTLDDIENKMTEIALTTDSKNFFVNSKKMDMLEKVGKFKLAKMELEAKISEDRESIAPEPITVKFVSSNTDEQRTRLERLQREVEDSVGGIGKNNA